MNRKRILISVAVCAALLLVASLSVSAQRASLTPNEQLGKLIFFDEALSINGNQSCATCHAPEVGWTGPDSAINAAGAVYEGSIPGAFGDRKPPSSAYATQSPILSVDRHGTFVGGNFWDGRATGEKLGNPAADQAQGPFLNPKEQALPDSACVVYFVCTAAYDVPFTSVWGEDACDIAWPADVETVCATVGGVVVLSDDDRAQSDMNYDSIALSIAAYEASPEVNAFTSKFDLSKRGQAKLTQQERQGWALFQGQAKCARCHIANGQQPLFTDFTFDNLGIPKNPENPFSIANPDWADPGLGGFLATRPDYAPYAAASMGMHKVPTVRNVDLRPDDEVVKAFGHNGYFKSLEGIVHFYNTRDVKDVCPGAYTEAEALAANCWPPPEVPENVNTAELGDLGLSADQEAAIVAFLKTLSDGYAAPSSR
jgi:cytochrome c peroxidase